jgi:hypothetical protein
MTQEEAVRLILEFQSHSVGTANRLRTDSDNNTADLSEPLVLESRPAASSDGSSRVEFPDEIDIITTFIGVERDFQNQVMIIA